MQRGVYDRYEKDMRRDRRGEVIRARYGDKIEYVMRSQDYNRRVCKEKE